MDPCPVLVGRQQELSALRALLDAGGGVAIVSGEAGIGKSRLVREFASEAAAAGRVVLWARPEEVAQPGPYALIVDLLESIAERGDREVRTEARALAAELTPSGLTERRSTLASRTVAAALRGLLAQANAPLAIFEDLHRADESSHATLMHLARVASDDGHLIVGTMRPESTEGTPSLARLLANLSRERIGEQIHLEPLGPEAISDMLSAIWNRNPSEKELATVSHLGEGIPFFIEELAGTEISTGTRKVPRSVTQTIMPRLMSLGSEGSKVIRTASLVLGAIDLGVLSAASGLGVEAVAKHLTAAMSEGLIADREGNLTFRHALVREAIAAEMGLLESSMAHVEIARAIEKTYAGHLDRMATALAHHYQEGGETESAITYSILSGHRFLAFAATDDARTAFEQAVHLSRGSSVEALLGIAEADFRDGQEEAAGLRFRSAADALKGDGDRIGAAKALGRLAWTRMGRATVAEAVGPLDEALSLIPDDNSEEHVRLTIQKGNALLFAFGRSDEATPLLERARLAAEQLGNERLLAESLDGLAYASQRSSQWRQATELGREACAAAIRSEDPETIGRTHTNHAAALAVTGESISALEILEKARERLLRAHGRAGVGALDVTHAWISRLLGRPREAASVAARSHAAWQRWRGYRRIVEVWAALERGDLSLARSVVQAFWVDVGPDDRRLVTEDPKSASLEAAQALQCEVLLLASENPAESVDQARELVVADRHLNEAFDLGHSLAVLGRALVAAQALDEASEVVKELEDLGSEYPYHRAIASEVSGLVQLRSGNFDASEVAFRSAAAEFARIANQSDRARCERLWTEALLKVDPSSQPQVVEILRGARRGAEDAGALWEQNRIEAGLRSLGVRPRAGRPRKSQTSGELGGLSPREAEVAALVAAGVTNSDIGRQLFLSERTVQDHIGHALRKLGLSGRAALASWAVRQGMI